MSQALPAISVIVRTSGRPARYLARALAAVVAQTHPVACIIVVDDSEVGPAPVVPDGFSGVWLSREQGRMGNRSRALNRGIAQVLTPWLAFLDDDDTWHPEFLARLSKAAGNQTMPVCCRTQALYEEETEVGFRLLGEEPFNPDFVAVAPDLLVRGNQFTNNAVLWPHEVFAVVGNYREDLAMLEDWEFNVRAARRYGFTVLPETLAYYHQRPRQLGGRSANSAKTAHDQTRAQLIREWRAAGWLPPDRGWEWLVTRFDEARHRWARWRFASRWGRHV